jgi:hypothetical protein
MAAGGGAQDLERSRAEAVGAIYQGSVVGLVYGDFGAGYGGATMTLLQRLLGCHTGEVWCKWGHFDNSKPSDQLRYRWLSWCERDKITELFYARGNEAAALEESLRFRLIHGGYPVTIEPEEADEMMAEIAKLGATARSISWLESGT